MPNRLAQETSPYLLQHQDNPVDWFPWGEEALARARAENKPILLSIGYSACHWCHVMERESFENPGIARLMNENFINIKVDREERPDLDQIYQNVAQALTHSGGWPLTVFLTPELKPYFGGTYFPPEDRFGRPGFARALVALSDAYKQDQEGVAENARRLTEFIGVVESVSTPSDQEGGMPTMEGLVLAAQSILSLVDWTQGGTEGAPKFPNAMLFSFLWRMGTLTEDEEQREAALLLLEKMALGGIYDQLGGGFHRYSVDETWTVPHFEKMLYDNGILLKLYSEVLLSGGEAVSPERRELFTRVVGETVSYALREMRSPDGGFYAAQDADSEGEEGRYFAWSPPELRERLSLAEYEAFARHYGVTEAGNFEDGKSVLRIPSLERAEANPETQGLLESARAKLLKARAERVKPGTDYKILTGWNGLMISGLAWASLALRAEGAAKGSRQIGQSALEAAKGALELIQTKLSREGDRLWGSLQAGRPKLNGYLDDYAFAAMAALDVARASSDPEEIRRAIRSASGWMRALITHFQDPEGAGYFFTSDDHEALIHRPKTVYDQAIPSGTAVALSCLAALAEIDPEGEGARFGQELGRQLEALFPLAVKAAQASGELLSASLLAFQGPVVVSGAQAYQACAFFPVFQRVPEAPGKLLVCHRRSCSLPLEGLTRLREEVVERVTRSAQS